MAARGELLCAAHPSTDAKLRAITAAMTMNAAKERGKASIWRLRTKGRTPPLSYSRPVPKPYQMAAKIVRFAAY